MSIIEKCAIPTILLVFLVLIFITPKNTYNILCRESYKSTYTIKVTDFKILEDKYILTLPSNRTVEIEKRHAECKMDI